MRRVDPRLTLRPDLMAGCAVLSGQRTGLLGEGIFGAVPAAASAPPELPVEPQAARRSASAGAAPAASSALRKARRLTGPGRARLGRKGSPAAGGIAPSRVRSALLPRFTVA